MRSKPLLTIQTPIPWIVFIVFLVLKLTNKIDWSWWWITAPIWIPYSIVVVLFIILTVFYMFKTVK